MKRALIGLSAAAFGLALSLISAPPQAKADTNGICLIGGEPVPNAPTDGSPILPDCSTTRRLQVQTMPDPSNPPTRVQVISLPSSAPISGAVNVQNPGDFPSPIPFPTSYAINNFPSTQNVNVLNPSAFPTPLANQPVTVTNQVTPAPFPASFSVNNVAAFPTPIPFPAVQTVNVNNFPTPTPQATQSVVQLPAKYTILSGSGTTILNTGATTFLGVTNISTSVQITAVTCYDSASAASGPVVINTALGLTPPWFPGGGIGLTNGLVCNVPLTLLGNGIAVYWRKT